ncbi:MAG: YtxH domain-containing protein [Anaerolineales bacterium]|nr:YtxH domain-containing protein [Anaerolineales bacterium]
MRKFFNYVFGLLLGVLIGGVIALLLAPSSGEEIRNEIQTRFMSFKNEINQAATTKRIELENQLHSLRKNS